MSDTGILPKLTIVDAIMGSGKTKYVISHLNKSAFGSETEPTPSRCIVVTPILTEVARIKTECQLLNFIDPQPVRGQKLTHLLELVKRGENIVTTHALFSNMTTELKQEITARNYELVLDEELSCVELYKDIKESDFKLLSEQGLVQVDSTGRIHWLDIQYFGAFDQFKSLCLNGTMYRSRGRVLWVFPANFLDCFERVTMLTYLFEGSFMSMHLRMTGCSFRHMTLNKGELVPWTPEAQAAAVAAIQGLVDIHEGKSNQIGKEGPKSHPLSKSWFNRNSALVPGLKSSVANWFRFVAKTEAADNAWTTFKQYQAKLKGARYTKGFISCTAKGTNDFRHKKSLAYLCNLFPHPFIVGYFEDHDLTVDQDRYALSELVQWVWRSQIRDGKPIKVLIPSERMRTLLKDWLSGVYFRRANGPISAA